MEVIFLGLKYSKVAVMDSAEKANMGKASGETSVTVQSFSTATESKWSLHDYISAPQTASSTCFPSLSEGGPIRLHLSPFRSFIRGADIWLISSTRSVIGWFLPESPISVPQWWAQVLCRQMVVSGRQRALRIQPLWKQAFMNT